MLGLLAEIREQTDRNHPYVGSYELKALNQKLGQAAQSLPPNERWMSMFRVAQIELRLGKENESIEHFLKCLQFAPQIVPDRQKLGALSGKILQELGVAYMRLGESQNCCARNHPDSCILPIQGGGVHTQTLGSEEAIKSFMYVLKNTDPDEKTHLDVRWLLNIAWMTLGKYPESVPGEYLIPPKAFESSEEFVRFKNIAQSLKLDTFSMSGGAIVDDFDQDDYLDLIVSPWDPRGQIRWFRNQQDGTFKDATEGSGLEGFCGGLNLIQADYDNDGDTDFYVMRGAWLGKRGQHPNSLMRNNGNGTFTDITLDVGMDQHFPTQTAAWADYDNDGDLDLFVGNESDESLACPSQLYQNDGNGRFRDVASEAGVTNDRFSKGVSWGDMNGDRYPDLFVSNQGGINRLYLNNRDGTFSDIAEQAGVIGPKESFPAWFWDYDNDGNLDLYVSVYAASTGDLTLFHLGKKPRCESSSLFRGDGNGSFKNVTIKSGLTRPDATMGANFGDLDNDGFLDFYLGTGFPKYDALMPSVMYRNRNGESFVDITTQGGFGNLQKGHAVAFADIDNDGDQDVFEQMGGAFPGDRYHDALYENPGFENHWLSLRLEGTESNRSAIGARICTEIEVDGKSRKIYRHVNSGGSFGANPLRQTIGLGQADLVKKLTIDWPTSGETQVFEAVKVDRHYRVVEGQEAIETLELKKLTLGKPNSQ